MEQQIGRAYYDLPWHYDKGEEVYVVFRTDRDVIKSLLPSILDVPDGPGLATVSAVHHARSTFGPYTGVYMGVLASYKGKTVGHRLTGIKTTFSGAAGGRELAGIPYQTGDASMLWNGDVLDVVAGRHGKEFVRLSVRLECRTEGPPASRVTGGTTVVRRPPWENAEKQNVLLGGTVDRADPKDMVFWKGSAVLKLVGGDPGDDWSILPVHEVLEVNYNIGGHSAITGAHILEEF